MAVQGLGTPEILSTGGDPPDFYVALVHMMFEDTFQDAPRAEVLRDCVEMVLDLGLAACGFRLSDPPRGLGWVELAPAPDA